MNEEESLLKRSMLLTAKLVGAFALWTLLLSLVVVGLTGRAVTALSGSEARKGETSADVDGRGKDKAGASRGATPGNVVRPNG
jgi:hypothetical protein